MNFKSRNILRNLLIAMLVLLTFVTIFPLMWKYSGLRRIKKGIPEDILQVFVVTNGEVDIIHFQSELDEYIKNHPDYSFLVPPGQEKKVNEQLVALYEKRFKERGIDAYPWVKVEQIGEGRQYLEVGLSGSKNEIVVWYEATDKERFPRYHQRFGAMLLLGMIILTAGLTGLIWLGVVVVYKIYRWSRNPLRGLP